MSGDPPSIRRTIADALVLACREAGTTHLFGVPGGGSNLDVVGAAEAQGIEFVLTHTETAAAVMAGVMGELTGSPGLCLATRGPGAASTVNGVAQALLDRQPVVVVTDCVAAADQARVSHQRLDHQALMGSVTKASLVLDGRDPGAPTRAVQLALDGRPGPVHVDIDPTASTDSTPTAVSGPQHANIDVEALVAGAERPVLVVGVGAVMQPPATRRAIADAVQHVAAAGNVPVLCTYKARGMVDDAASWSAGVATGGTIESPLLDAADLIIGVGFDPVELIPAAWPYEAPVLLVGPWPVDDSTFFGARLAGQLVGDLPSSLERLGGALRSTWPETSGARHRLRAAEEIRAARPRDASAGLLPQQIIETSATLAPTHAAATVDAGAHMLVAMPLWPVSEPGRLLISSGLATMGFALPAAIAAGLARDEPVICFTGDGGLGMTLAELETMARLRLPIVVVVFNDSSLSLIAIKQAPQAHGGAAAVTYRPTDFAAIARGCGVRAATIDDLTTYRRTFAEAVASGEPWLLDVQVDPTGYGAVLEAIRGERTTPG